MPNAASGQAPGGRGDVDDDTSGKEGEAQQQARRTSEVGKDEYPIQSEIDIKNQQQLPSYSSMIVKYDCYWLSTSIVDFEESNQLLILVDELL